MRFCFDCGCKLDKVQGVSYPWGCPYCRTNIPDEFADEQWDLEAILYGLYLHDWVANHDEGAPVCFHEFEDNEFMENEIVNYLLTKYGLRHMLREYNDIMDVHRYFANTE